MQSYFTCSLVFVINCKSVALTTQPLFKKNLNLILKSAQKIEIVHEAGLFMRGSDFVFTNPELTRIRLRNIHSLRENPMLWYSFYSTWRAESNGMTRF